MPRYVALATGENDLTVDLDNVLNIEMLAHEVKDRPFVSLAEMLPGPGQLCASGPGGRFTHQVIVPFARSAPKGAPKPAPKPTAAPAGPPAATPCPRRFAPGSEWL